MNQQRSWDPETIQRLESEAAELRQIAWLAREFMDALMGDHGMSETSAIELVREWYSLNLANVLREDIE